MLFIGGRRSIIGAVVGALLIQYLQGASSWVSVNILVVEGVLLTDRAAGRRGGPGRNRDRRRWLGARPLGRSEA